MPERTMETYERGRHVVDVVEETEEGSRRPIGYQARCACGWTGAAKYYQPVREASLKHLREEAAR